MNTIPRNIIPHNPINVQVSISKKTDEIQTFCNTSQILMFGLSKIQQEAYRLYDAGLNVLPQPIGRKGGLPWKRLQYSRLNRDDDSYGLTNLFAGQCNIAVMCGLTSNNLFVIDCESQDSFLYHLDQMRQRNIPMWAAKTARGGHIYLCAENGEVHNIEPGILLDAEIKGQSGYVLAPPSIHPDGTGYTWLCREGKTPAIVHTDKIDWLKDQHSNPVHLVVDKPSSSSTGNWSMHVVSPTSNLSNQTRNYLQTGSQVTVGNRNNRLFSAACDLNGNHYSQSEAEHILLPIAVMSGLTRYEAKATITSAYSKNRTPARPTQENAYPILTWRYALLWATKHDWKGRCGVSDRSLFLALIERARVSSNENDVFRASIRELSELSRLGTTTVQRSLIRLENTNVIFNCGYDKTSQASLWRFSDKIISIAKQIELNTNTVSIAPHWLSYSESVFNSDVVERGGLGHSVMFIYQFMRTLHKPMMPLEIADSMGVSVNQVNYALRKMRQYELVRRLDEGWYLTKMTLPELESLFEHVAGKGDARVAKYRREREIFAGYIIVNARIRREGRSYTDAVSRYQLVRREYKEALEDPLLRLGLELGGVLRHSKYVY